MKPIVIEDASKLYFTADPHFNHANIIKYCNRPFTDVNHMNYMLVANWNKRISHDDTIIILGDFGYGDKMELTNVLNQLSGHKFLITGNHDRDNQIPRHKFLEIFDGYKTLYVKEPDRHREITLCHFPMLSWPHSHKGSWQLYGHWHSSNIRMAEGTPEEEKEISDYVQEEGRAYKKTRPTQYDVGVDGNGYSPISYYEISKIIESQLKEYEKSKS